MKETLMQIYAMHVCVEHGSQMNSAPLFFSNSIKSAKASDVSEQTEITVFSGL